MPKPGDHKRNPNRRKKKQSLARTDSITQSRLEQPEDVDAVESWPAPPPLQQRRAGERPGTPRHRGDPLPTAAPTFLRVQSRFLPQGIAGGRSNSLPMACSVSSFLSWITISTRFCARVLVEKKLYFWEVKQVI
ncbi:hypothetical protein ABZP36_020721 [Zizania latifolia]